MTFALPKTDEEFDALNARFTDLSLEDRLRALVDLAPGRIVFTTSFGQEDQAITHAIFTSSLPIDVVTLDTGRFFDETYSLWADTQKRYGKPIQPFYPNTGAVESLVKSNGINGFYDSVEARKACCHVRKVEPLNRALSGASLWITGIRADQNASRQSMAYFEHDAARDLYKANPMLDWSTARLEDYVAEHGVSVNELHARGYPSIGCQPCTRAIEPGEDPRAGRWWWEQESGAGGECGLHVGPDGRLVRSKKPAQSPAQSPSGTLVD
jgi:phosphoadenosine phosphosulfate reductase